MVNYEPAEWYRLCEDLEELSLAEEMQQDDDWQDEAESLEATHDSHQ